MNGGGGNNPCAGDVCRYAWGVTQWYLIQNCSHSSCVCPPPGDPGSYTYEIIELDCEKT